MYRYALFLALFASAAELRAAGFAADVATSPVDAVIPLLDLVLDADEGTARECLGIVTRAAQNGELSAERLAALREQLGPRLNAILGSTDHPLRFDAALLATVWQDHEATRIARETLANPEAAGGARIVALQSLIAGSDEHAFADAQGILNDGQNAVDLRQQVLGCLGRLESPDVATFVLAKLDDFEPELRTRALELLTQRPEWSAPLLAAIADKRMSKDVLNLNQLRRIASFDDPQVKEQFTAIYGALREGRDPDRERLVKLMKNFLEAVPGDPHRGETAFKKVCAQCHKIYGEGAEVGPEITLNGRNNWDQLISNVFDPSLVIGAGYQARQLLTVDGRVLTGLPVEESDQRVVLKVQGGKIETIARDDIEEYKVSEVSLMPEELEKQLTKQEIADLMSYLALDRPPSDPAAKYLPGAPAPKR
ncbi:MAG: c-type cytochrome [Planctomycetaceae bacterium]|nr:c-type cytochrome [Planctomycetaceae bacterium]